MAFTSMTTGAPNYNTGAVRLGQTYDQFLPSVISDPRATEYAANRELFDRMLMYMVIQNDATKGQSLTYMIAAYDFRIWNKFGAANEVQIIFQYYNKFSFRADRRRFHGYRTNFTMQEMQSEALRTYDHQETRQFDIDKLLNTGSDADHQRLLKQHNTLVASESAVALRSLFDDLLAVANAIHYMRSEPIEDLIARFYNEGYMDVDKLRPEDKKQVYREATLFHFQCLGAVNFGNIANRIGDINRYKEKWVGEGFASQYPHVVVIPIVATSALKRTNQIREVDGIAAKGDVKRLEVELRKSLVSDMHLTEDNSEYIIKNTGSKDTIRTLAHDMSKNLRGSGIKTYKFTDDDDAFYIPVPTVMAPLREGARRRRELLNTQKKAVLLMHDTIPAVCGEDGPVWKDTVTIYDMSNRRNAQPQAVSASSAFKAANIVNSSNRVPLRYDAASTAIQRATQVGVPEGLQFQRLYRESFTDKDPVLQHVVQTVNDGFVTMANSCMSLGDRIAFVIAIGAIEDSNILEHSGIRQCSQYISNLKVAIANNPLIENSNSAIASVWRKGDFTKFPAITGFPLSVISKSQYDPNNNDHAYDPSTETYIDVAATRAAVNRTLPADNTDNAIVNELHYLMAFIALTGIDPQDTVAQGTALAAQQTIRDLFENCDSNIPFQILIHSQVVQWLVGAYLQQHIQHPLSYQSILQNTTTPHTPLSCSVDGLGPPNLLENLAATLTRQISKAYLKNVTQDEANQAARSARKMAKGLMQTKNWGYASYLFSRAISSDVIREMHDNHIPIPYDLTILRRLDVAAHHAIVNTFGTMIMNVSPFQTINELSPRQKQMHSEWHTRSFPAPFKQHTHVIPGVYMSEVSAGNTKFVANYSQFLRDAQRDVSTRHGTVMGFLPGYGLKNGDIDSATGSLLDWQEYRAHSVFLESQTVLFRPPKYVAEYLENVAVAKQHRDTHPMYSSSKWRRSWDTIVTNPRSFNRDLHKSRIVPIVSIPARNARGFFPGFEVAHNKIMQVGPGMHGVMSGAPSSTANDGSIETIPPIQVRQSSP